jgi:phytanoyl-CoA hydroxylase
MDLLKEMAMNLNELFAEYQENGFVKLPAFFSPQDLQEIEAQLAKFIEKTAPSLSGKDINYTGGQINSIHALSQNSKFFSDLLVRPKVTELVSHLLNDEAEPRLVEFFAKPARVGLPSPMHQDNFYWCLDNANGLTVWIALDHCDETNGGLSYFKGSHKLGTLDHKDSFAPGSSQTIRDYSILGQIGKDRILVPLTPGDCLAHHSNTIHGSAANPSERSRRGVTMQFKGKHAGYDAKMKAHYEARLQEQVQTRAEKKN